MDFLVCRRLLPMFAYAVFCLCLAANKSICRYGYKCTRQFTVCSAFAFGARMRGVVCFGQMLEIQSGIYLCRADTGMPQHFLHCS